MIATREADRTKSFVFEKAAKQNVIKKAKEAGMGGTGVLDKLLNEELSTAAEENISYTQRSANRLNCRRIASAVRIADFVVRDYLYIAAESCLSSFLAKFNALRCGDISYGDIGIKMVIRDLRTDDCRRGDVNDDDNSIDDDVDLNLSSLYGIDASLPPPHMDELEIELYPNKRKALSALHSLITEIFNACRHETSLLHHSLLKDIFRPIANELADTTILDLIYFDEQNSIHDLTNRISDILEQDMTKCERTVRGYEFLIESYCRSSNEANSLTIDILGKWTVEQIAQKFKDIAKETYDIKSLPCRITVGIASLDISDTVSEVVGQLDKIRETYCQKIPNLFVVLGEQLYQKAHFVKAKLIKKYTVVENYVAAIEVYNAALINAPELDKSFEYLTGLKNIIRAQNIPTTDEMYGIDTTLKTEFQKYQESLISFEDGMEDATKHFQKELLVRSKKIVVPIEEIELSIASELFTDPNSDSAEVLEELNKLEAKFNAACDESAYLVKAQHLMKFFVFDGLHADRIQYQLSRNRILWKAVEIIRSTMSYILDTHFQRINCYPVQMKIQAISKTISKLDKQDPTPVETWVKESILMLESVLPIIVQLKCDSYTDDQIAELESLLQHNVYSGDKNQIWTGQSLVDMNLLNYAKDIEAIYHRNACECNLQKKLIVMQTRLDKMEVQIAQDREITYRINNLDDCADFLEDLVITTSVCLQSHFVSNFKDEYVVFHEKVQRYLQLIQWISVFQKEGLRLRSFYTNPKITRHLHQGFKHFNVVDESWRSLIKLGRSDNLMTSLLSSSRLKNLEIINNAVTIAFDVIYGYLESQRVNAPRLYFLSDAQCYDMFCHTDIKTVFDLPCSTLFPNLSSISLGADGDNVFVEGVRSGTESIRFKSVCPLKIVLGDWINDIDKALMDHVIQDIWTLVTEERSIIEDARYPICTNQAKIVGLEVKFWEIMQGCFQGTIPRKSRPDMLKNQKSSILDNIVILGTISGLSKDSYQVQSVANMILCLIQQRDLFEKAFGDCQGGAYFEKNAFFLECAIQKYFDKKTSEISVRHLMTELSYGYKYLGFSSANVSLAVTPLTEKCYLAISATFHKSSQLIPCLRGCKNGPQLNMLQTVTNSFGVELFPVDCSLLDPSSAESSIKRSITGAINGKFHTCYTSVQSLSSTTYSFLIQSLTSTMLKLSDVPKEKLNTKNKFDLWRAIQQSQSPHFSLSLGIDHVEEAAYFPASIRKRFRMLHIISPRISDVLAAYLEAFGFENPRMACVRLSGFVDHMSTLCAIDYNLLFKLLIHEAIPEVGSMLVKTSTLDISQQCYMVVKKLFKGIPSHFQESITPRNLQYACSVYLNIYFDPEVNMHDFKAKDENVEPCGNIIAALMKRKCAIVIGAVDCGKTTAIREAVGRIEGFGSYKKVEACDDIESDRVVGESDGRGGTDDDNSSTQMRSRSSLSTSLAEPMHVFESRNSLYSAEESYPRKLFRHQINPVLFNNVEVESNATSVKIPWSCVSKCASKATTADKRRASILGSEVDDANTKIDNNRHFDSLDRFLYDISTTEDVSYLHIDVTNSSDLSHYMNRLTHNCPNKFSPSLTSMGYNLIWECLEISQIDPGLATSVPIVCIPEKNYSAQDTVALQMKYFLKKFDYQPTGDELGRVSATPLLTCLTKSVEIFVHPFLDPNIFDSLKSVQSIHVVVRTFFEIATAMYKYVGLDVSTTVHPRQVTIIYDSSHQESTVVEKQMWCQKSFFSIMAYASIWSFGCCSPISQVPFEAVYTTMKDNLATEISTWESNLQGESGRNMLVLPPTSSVDEECFPYYEYYLCRDDMDEVDVTWMHWKRWASMKKMLPTDCFDKYSHIRNSVGDFYCTVSDYFHDSVFVPTYLSVISTQLKDALMLDKQSHDPTKSSSSHCFSALAIIGQAGIGKSSLLFMLANSMDKRKHWKGLIEDDSPHKVHNAVLQAKKVFHSYLVENDLPFVGAFFIDDVNLDKGATGNLNTCGADLYQRMFSGQYHYDTTQRKWIRHDNVLYGISATLGDNSLNQRMLQHCIALSFPTSSETIASVFSSKFLTIFPHISNDLAFDIANITVRVFDQFKSEQLNDCCILPMILTCPAPLRVKYVFAGILKSFEKSVVVSSGEVCRCWKKIVSDVTNGSFNDRIFQGVLESQIDNTSHHRSNIKGIISKGQENGQQSLTGTRTSVRSSFRPTLKKMSVVENHGTCVDDVKHISEGNPKRQLGIFMISPEELMLRYLPEIQHIFLDNFQLLDFESMLFWKDVQKCVGYLNINEAPFALFWGPSKPILNVVIESSCFLTKWNYLPFTLDGRKKLPDFILHYVHSFCYFLLVAHEKDMKLNNKFVDAVRKKRKEMLFEEGTKFVPESMLKLWHIHLNDSDLEITSEFWTLFSDIIYLKTPDCLSLLHDVYDISFSKYSKLQSYLLHFQSHVKIVFSFGVNTDDVVAVKELCYIPKLSNRMQNVHFSTMYRMNSSLLLNAFDDDVKVADSVTRAITNVVSDMAEHVEVENSIFLELARNSHYEEGTYGLICQIFQLSVDPSSARIWDSYTEQFMKLSSLIDDPTDQVGSPLHKHGSEELDEDEVDENEGGDVFGSDIDKTTKNSTSKLANAVWASILFRYFSFCPVSRRNELESSAWDDMINNSLTPDARDIRVVAYAYLHTMVETNSTSIPSTFVELFDTIILCGECIASSKIELCSLLLMLVSESSVRVVGNAQCAIPLMADVLGVDVKVSKFKIHQCDSYDLEEIMSISEDRTKVLYAEESTRNSTQTCTESILSISKRDELKSISQRTPVIVFDMLSTACSDIFLLYFLMKGFSLDVDLQQSFAYISQLSMTLNMKPSVEYGSRENEVAKLSEDLTSVLSSHLQILKKSWTAATHKISSHSRTFSAFCSSIAAFQPTLYDDLPSHLFAFMRSLLSSNRGIQVESVLTDFLSFYYSTLSNHLNEGILLVLKTNTVILLSEYSERICSTILRQIINLLKKRVGLLGLHPSQVHNDDILPTNDSFDVFNMVYEYLNRTCGNSSPCRLTMDGLEELFLSCSESIEEWANMYSIDHTLPIPDEALIDMSYIDRILIVAVLKPVDLDTFVTESIFELSQWKAVSNESYAKDPVIYNCDYATVAIYENPTGAFDLNCSTSIPYFVTNVHLEPTVELISASTGLQNTCSLNHMIVPPKFDTSVDRVIERLMKMNLTPGTSCIVECQNAAVIHSHVKVEDCHVLVKRFKTATPMWYQYPILLKKALNTLLSSYVEYSSGMPVKTSMPSVLVRVFWLLSIFHVSVVIRLNIFHPSIGDDILIIAGRLLIQLRMRSVHEPELMFSKLENLVNQVYHQVYDLATNSIYAKTVTRSLFENVFTIGSTDPDSEYYLLGLLPLPSQLDVFHIDSFAEDIIAVLTGGDCIHISDFIGCTNGELYEMHIKDILWQEFERIPDIVTAPSPLVNRHHRIKPAIEYLLGELPALIAVNKDLDDANLRSLCTSQRKAGRKKSVAIGADENESSLSDQNSPTRRLKGVKNNGENHLWFYLQLEIECYNSSLVACKEALTSMLDHRTCPAKTSSMISDLENNHVPSAWLKYSHDEDKEFKVPLNAWVRQLFIRRKMLIVWLSQRYPEYIYLHLLHNPEGLIYALKQCFAESQNKAFTDVVIDARILQLPFTSVERHSEIAKINIGNSKSNIESFSVVIAGVHLMNARWLEEHYNLEFLNPSFASKFSQELYLKVSATCEDTLDEDDYQCPLYTASDFPTTNSIMSTVSSSAVTTRPNRSPIFKVSIPSHCPNVEWKKRNVCMHASPDWHVPGV